MKAIHSIIAVAALATLASGQDYNNIVRQFQLKTGGAWDMQNLPPSGNANSPRKLQEEGALFQLWTIESSIAKDHLLDQQLVGAYLPHATVAIATQDPHAAFARTRVDKPFTVTINVENLLSDSRIPEASSKVLLERHVVAYPSGKFSLDPAVVAAGTPYSSSYITANGTITLDFPASSVPGEDPMKACGEEHFTIYAIADGTQAKTRIATTFVQVWPVTFGAINGIRNGDVVRFTAPIITISVEDLYPRSDAYIQVYKGSPALGTTGTMLNHFSLSNTSDKSESSLRTVEGYVADLPDQGTYTMELIAKTPFGLERLDHVTFTVDRTLRVNAMQVAFSGEPE